MQTSRPLATAAAAAVAALLLAAAPSSSDATVTVDGNSVTVTGSLDEALEPVVLGTDPAGDALVPETGADLTGLSVSFPSTGQVSIHLEIDPNPATGFQPYGVQYSVAPSFGSTSVELIANALPTGLVFASQTCEEGPGGQTCTSSPVDGSYADGVLTWTLNLPGLPGDTIFASAVEANPQANFVVGPTLTFIGGLYDTLTPFETATVPSATLLVDGVTATSGFLFDGFSLTAVGLEAGERTIGVELCGPDGDCSVLDLGTVTIE